MPSDKAQRTHDKKKNDRLRTVDDLELLKTIIEQSPQLRERVLEKILTIIGPSASKAGGLQKK